jgi:uncharacterized membrane protein
MGIKHGEFDMDSTRKADWMIPAGLIALSVIPAFAGFARIHQIVEGIRTEDSARFLASPWSVTLHIVGATLFCVLGAFQFAPGLRRRHLQWHRIAGRLLLPCGFAASLSGLWMTQFYPPFGFDGPALYWLRLAVGLLMTLFLWLSIRAILRMDVPGHRAWMIRAYALGIGAGTQVITHIPWFLLPDLQSEFFRTLCMGAGWGINAIVAEFAIGWAPRRFPAGILAASDERHPNANGGARASKQ